jgi:ubiquinone/menaquinone biosynthesis C-methylase UbiE
VALPASRNFDRAPPYYDRTRGLPPEVTAQLTELLGTELAGRGPSLEIGVGTGRVALPLHEAGVPMTGMDLSRAMMTVLVGKAGGRPPFPLVQGDATALAFPDDAFGAGLASHVFHLIPQWRAALAELLRVVRPGGLILSDQGAEDTSPVRYAVRAKFLAELGPGAGHIGADQERGDIERALVEFGASKRALPVIRAERRVSLARMIDSLEAGQWSWTWDLPDEARHAAAARTRTWATDAYGPLDAPLPLEHEVRWLAFDLP